MCKKHTQTLKSDRFATNFVWILSFSEKCKNQGSFCKCLIINKVFFLYLTEHGGTYENGACFYQPPFLSEKFTLKILTLQTYLVGGRSENAGKFLSTPNGLFGFLPTFYPQKSSILTEVMGEDKKTMTVFSSLTKILWSFFHKTASQVLFRCFLPLTRTLPQPSRHALVNAKKAARFFLPPSGFLRVTL